MMTADINYIAIITAGVFYMILGFLWYGPIFGNAWMKLMGMKKSDMTSEQKASMSKTYAISFGGSLVMLYILAHFVDYLGASTAMAGATTGFWAWLGFVATTGLNEYLYTNKPKPWSLYAINQGYFLVSLLVGGAILATWA